MASQTPNDFLDELSFRGLLHQATHEAELRQHLSSEKRLIYVGFDPTADSLTIGNLVPLTLLRHAQRAGHTPVVVMGGGTGLIGDPSGKSAERMLLDADVVAANVQGQRRIFERLLDFSPSAVQAQLLNNLDWLQNVSYLHVLRDVGKYFSVNAMIQRDSVRDRLHNRDQGISYTEFSYMILQAYDFLHLAKTKQVSVQMGGSDQFGNIVSGCDLIRRLLPNAPAFGLTAPLLTRADGGKFGKTEKGSIWLTADRTSPYALYQFFLNTDDQDVIRFLKLFTFLPQAEIIEMEHVHHQNPGARVAHQLLAKEMVATLHGPTALARAQQATQALFSGELQQLPESLLKEVLGTVPCTQHAYALLEGDGLPLVEALAVTSLAKSKREAREFLAAGSIFLHGQKAEPTQMLTKDMLLYNKWLPLRRSKKQWHVLSFENQSI